MYVVVPEHLLCGCQGQEDHDQQHAVVTTAAAARFFHGGSEFNTTWGVCGRVAGWSGE